jgi:chitin disaccharide deacetylase
LNSFKLKGLILFVILWALSATITKAQTENKTLAEKLGYLKEAKLLIIHTDDVGLAHSVNEATIKSFENESVNSGSIMVPCPWFGEAAVIANQNPDYDLGIHLTLTSEWEFYRWGGITPSTETKTLLDPKGYLYPDVPEVIQYVHPQDVAKECRAQIDRAIAFGINPTHFDTHMGTLLGSPELVDIYLRLGKEYNIPVFLPRENIVNQNPEMIAILEQGGFIMVDRYFMAEPSVQIQDFQTYYTNLIKNLKPGVTQIIVHVGLDNPELQAVMINHPHYGSAWRQKDYDVFTSESMKNVIQENHVKLITWREIGKLLQN